ncbi:MAG: hypothetical protein HOO67_04485 [Candidatus Peribacteraceae bacterium]|nr:hypothetical protein [Candidatus Peribacteraceae bacterium]
MEEVRHIHEDSGSASIVMMVALVIILAIAAGIGFLAYNGTLFSAAADQGSDINIEGDVNLPPSTDTPPATTY